MANISAFQANDESSILSARTKEITVLERLRLFLWYYNGEIGFSSAEQSEEMRVRS